jgi:hypothetical protein
MNEEWTKCINWGRSVMQLSSKNFNSQGHFLLNESRFQYSPPEIAVKHAS